MDAASYIGKLLWNLGTLAPEVVLLVIFLIILVMDIFVVLREKTYGLSVMCIVGCLLSLHVVLLQFYDPDFFRVAFGETFAADKFTLYFKLLFIVSAFFTALFTLESRRLDRYRTGEYYALLVLSTAALCVLVSARHFLPLYVALEILHLCLYVFVSYRKDSSTALRGGLSFFRYSIMASGILLVSISFIYGVTGTLDVQYAFIVLAVHPFTGIVILLLLGGTVAVKLLLIPLYFGRRSPLWTAPLPVVAFLCVGVGIGGFGALIRMLLPLFRDVPIFSDVSFTSINAHYSFYISVFLGIVAVAGMTVGNLAALRQKKLKPLILYSCLAHIGYICMGLAALESRGLQSVLFYLGLYLFMNMGIFYCALLLDKKTGSGNISDYRGLYKHYPLLAVTTTVLVLSLTGLPPFGGFMGKYLVFTEVIRYGTTTPLPIVYYLLVAGACINCLISFIYYFRVARTMFRSHGKESAPSHPRGIQETLLLWIFILAMLTLFFLWRPPYTHIQYITNAIVL